MQLTFPDHLTSDLFLLNYWQSKPLLMRQAIADFAVDLDAETLAGLSMEESIRSRIVAENNAHWDCRFGPFENDDFADLPETHWTLLVQDVEKHLPEYAYLLDCFSFLPRWRVDDLMVSYAVDGGSVGPHTDNYDVFLLQAKGQRQWQIQTQGIRIDDLLPDTDLKILQDFEAEEEWILNPGDILYLPPGVAHHGIALGDCMTFSIGFRAPSQLDVLQSYTDLLSAEDGNHQHYIDQANVTVNRRGELTAQNLADFRQLLLTSMNDESLVTQAVASLLTQTTDTPALYAETDKPLLQFKTKLATADMIKLHPAVRSLYIRQADQLDWYLNSVKHSINLDRAAEIMRLVDTYTLSSTDIQSLLQDEYAVQTLYELHQEGGLKIEL